MSYNLPSIRPLDFTESPGVLTFENSEIILYILIYNLYSNYLSLKYYKLMPVTSKSKIWLPLTMLLTAV